MSCLKSEPLLSSKLKRFLPCGNVSPTSRHSAMVRLSNFSKEAKIQNFIKVNPIQLQILATFLKKNQFASRQQSACKPPIPYSGLKAALVIGSSMEEGLRDSLLIGMESGELT